MKAQGLSSLLVTLKKVNIQLFFVVHFLTIKWLLNWNFSIIRKYTMLTKKEIEQLIEKKNSSLKIVKPTVTPKSSAVWNNFSCIYVNDIKQEYVICNQCEDLLIYKPSSGTNSLSKHIRSCQKVKPTTSHIFRFAT